MMHSTDARFAPDPRAKSPTTIVTIDNLYKYDSYPHLMFIDLSFQLRTTT